VALGALAGELAGETAAGERAPHHDAHALILDERQDFALKLAPGDGVIGLHRLEPGKAATVRDALRLHDLPRREIGAADGAHEAARDAIVERAHRLLEGRDV